jgi:hypothetical protein
MLAWFIALTLYAFGFRTQLWTALEPAPEPQACERPIPAAQAL